MNGLLFAFLLGVCCTINSQNTADSLLTIHNDKTLPIAERTGAYLEYLYEIKTQIHPDSSITLAKKLYDFTKKNNDSIGRVDILLLLGYSYFETGQYPQALETYKEAGELSTLIDDKNALASTLYRTGIVYHDNGNLSKAIEYYRRSESIYESINSIEGLSTIYNEFWSLYSSQDDFEKALEYYQKSLDICERDGNSDSCSAQYANIGTLYYNHEDYEIAREYFTKSIEICKKINDRYGIASSYSGIGITYYSEGNFDKALQYINQSLDINNQLDNTVGISIDYQDLGNIYIDKGDYKRAISYCKKSLDLALEINDLDNQIDPCNCLYEAYAAIGNYKKALEYLENTENLEDSLQVFSVGKKLQELEFQKKITVDSLAQAKKDLQLELQHQTEIRKKDRNRNIAISAGIVFLILAAGFFARWKLVNKSKKIIEKEKDRSENLLLNILPAEIAEELKIKGKADAKDFDLASILFTDFKGFTKMSESLTAKELIEEINSCFEAFDFICEKYQIEKIKTIGDAYMAAGGLPIPSNESIKKTVLAALEMRDFIKQRIIDKKAKNEIPFEMRLGVHTGPVVAGIVGVKKFQYLTIGWYKCNYIRFFKVFQIHV